MSKQLPTEPQELVDILDTYYEGDPKVGDVVMLRHRFEHTSIAGQVTGLSRHHAHRGYDPENDYEIVVYQEYKLKLAGIKGWLGVSEEEEWEVTEVMDGKEWHKLKPDVVLQSSVDDLIDAAQDESEDDEL